MSEYGSIKKQEILKQIEDHQNKISILNNKILKLRKQLNIQNELSYYFSTSLRITNCIQNKGILTIEDLLKHSASDLLKIKNFGPKSLNEVRLILKLKGLYLRGDKNE